MPTNGMEDIAMTGGVSSVALLSAIFSREVT
jgi:hypothetical protein